MNREHQVDDKKKLWPRLATLAATLCILSVLLFAACDFMGIAPNVGLPFGYYGRFNQVLGQVEASPKVKVLRTALHKDLEIEDFYITVQTQDEREVRLRFEQANTRPFDELVLELKKAGI